MSEESTTPDLVELARRYFAALNRRDLDAMVSFFAPHAVWETVGLGTTFEGVAAIRGFWQDWYASYEELWLEQEGYRVVRFWNSEITGDLTAVLERIYVELYGSREAEVESLKHRRRR